MGTSQTNLVPVWAAHDSIGGFDTTSHSGIGIRGVPRSGTRFSGGLSFERFESGKQFFAPQTSALCIKKNPENDSEREQLNW
jgi:hypothetical protein